MIVSDRGHFRWPLRLWGPRRRNPFQKFWYQKSYNYIDITPIEWTIEERLLNKWVGMMYDARKNRPKRARAA